jgi:acyl-coenzyme A synthetase/AMP-(fatty) acid ligase
MNEHRGVVNRLLWMQEQYPLTSTDVVLQKTPYSFDVSVWEFFWPLLAGARLVIAKPGGHKDPRYLIELVNECRVTTIHFVPPMLRTFLAEPGVESCRSLRHVICSGEALPFELQEVFFEKLLAALHNLYGPTEAAVHVTHWTCQRNSPLRIVPIGKPVANTQTYILNECLQPVPVGVPGELHIGGIQVGRGYLRRPELTAERFIQDPFQQTLDARLYKTGDLCRYLADGSIEYLDRLDSQVKIRGFRIELGEIESVLCGHPAVREAAVLVRGKTPEDRLLVAYLVMNLPTPLNQLREHLKKHVPDFMVPSVFVFLERLPLNPNGKLDRKALPEDQLRPELTEAYVAPRNETEKILAEIWTEVLQLERIGIHDNFFELGGHSLLVLRVVSRIRQRFNLDVPLTVVFETQNIAELATSLSDRQIADVDALELARLLDEIESEA